MNKSAAEKRLIEKKAELEKVRAAYDRALLSQSYSIRDGETSREVSNANITSLYNQKLALEKQIEKLEAIVDGGTCEARRIGIRL